MRSLLRTSSFNNDALSFHPLKGTTVALIWLIEPSIAVNSLFRCGSLISNLYSAAYHTFVEIGLIL